VRAVPLSAVGGAVALVITLLMAAATLAAPPKLGPLMRPMGKAIVDWEEGVVFARAGAAADLRLPGVDAPRAAAVRAARGRAAKQLEPALAKIPLGKGRKRVPGAMDSALARGQVLDPDYQTNGGVVLALGVQLAHLVEPPPPASPKPAAPAAKPAARPEPAPPSLVLAVTSMPFEVAPTVVVKGKPYALGSAVYRLGKPPKDALAIPARRDGKGRLVLSKAPADLQAAGARAVIYVRRSNK
jgi:hypothetical protein